MRKKYVAYVKHLQGRISLCEVLFSSLQEKYIVYIGNERSWISDVDAQRGAV